MTIFFELAAALALAAVFGAIFYFFRQPTIIGFIFAGIVIGYFGYLRDHANLELIEGFSSVGVALLLFIVGLEMRFGDIKEVGKHAVFAGLVQVGMTIGVTYLIAPLFGITGWALFYIGAALAFSSTVVVIKILSEKRDLNSLYGRLTVGILLVQDVLAILVLIFLAGLGQGESPGFGFVFTILKAAFFIALTVGVSKIAPRILDFISKSPELLYLFSLSWAVGVSALFATPAIGLSIEIGGFLAGLALANSSEHFQISARMKPLRDFFLIILFIGLGAKMLTGGGVEIALPVIVFSLIVLVGNPIMIALALGIAGYRSRTSFLSGLSAAQISEFSFIVMFLGIRLGHIESVHVSIVAMVGIVTIFISSYLMIYNNKVYEFIRPFAKLFEFRKSKIEEKAEETLMEGHIILIGARRMGLGILRALSNAAEDFVAVDFDPKVVASLRKKKLPVIYGDITDPEIQELVGLNSARLVISTLPTLEDNQAILESLNQYNSSAKTIFSADNEHDSELLYRAGVDYVILPHFIGGAEVARLISSDPELETLPELKKRDLNQIGFKLK